MPKMVEIWPKMAKIWQKSLISWSRISINSKSRDWDLKWIPGSRDWFSGLQALLSKICSWSSDFEWIRNRVQTHSLNAKVVSMEGLLCYVGLSVFLEKTPRNFKKLRTPNIGANSHTGHFQSKVLKLWIC